MKRRNETVSDIEAAKAALGLLSVILDNIDKDIEANKGEIIQEADTLMIPTDGSAVELPISDKLEVFISEDGKPMVRKKIERKDKKEQDKSEPIPTYRRLAKALYGNTDDIYFWNTEKENVGHHSDNRTSGDWINLSNCMTVEQVKRLMAFNKLQNIARYLNGGWRPNFEDSEEDKYYIAYSGGGVIAEDGDERIYNFSVYNRGYEPAYSDLVYFKSEAVAWQAIRTMGEESLEDLFATDW